MRAEPQLTFLPHPDVPAWGRLALYHPTPQADPTVDAATLGLTATPAEVRLVLPGDDGAPAARSVEVAAADVPSALACLLALRTPDGRRGTADSVAFWVLASRVAWRLVRGERIVPALSQAADGTVRAVWRALPAGDAHASGVLAELAALAPPAAHAVPIAEDPARMWRAEDLLAAWCDAVADAAVRTACPDPHEGRPRARLLPWTVRWEEALRDRTDPVVPLGADAADLAAQVRGWLGQRPGGPDGGFTELQLAAPDAAEGPWELAVGVRTDTGELRDAAAVWDADLAADPDAAVYAETLLAGLGRCARVFPPLERALAVARPTKVQLSRAEAWQLLSEVAPLLEGAGVILRPPAGLDDAALRIRLRVGVNGQDPDAGEGADGFDAANAAEGDAAVEDDLVAGNGAGELVPAALSDPVTARWEIAVADEPLTEEEVADLLAHRDPLVFWRGRWVRIDPAEAERVAALTAPSPLPLTEALGLALLGGQPAHWDGPTAGGVDADVVADGAVQALLERLRAAAEVPPVADRPAGFTGTLRPYQQRGAGWLEGMGALGLGAVLADDMGLGKTIQLIAYLLARGGRGPHLVVCPTSVVGNWEREIGRFAPDLPVTRHHGPLRPDRLPAVAQGVWLTSYGTLRRDVDLLAEVAWDVVTLDEAQVVKNPSTAAAKAVRALSAAHVVALTGTPLENRLAELWSLMDVCNPGLLGSRAAFGRRFVTPIEQRRDPVTALRLRRLVAPFVLRREKTDPAVIDDLPDKIERTVACPLTAEQAQLYEAATADLLGGALADASDMQRRGRVLALLTRLKQICNHPAHANDDPPQAPLTGRSGKFATCRELVAAAVDGGERVLIFTQYVAMGRRLAAQLSADLDVDVPLLHGGVPPATRDRLVAGFQDERDGAPVLVVSLRAGGTGLNLTAATQVIHYDRWWNPAVEDQATDRAHRIGQRRTVEVHKLVTSGTVEERIADLLERKRALADAVVGAGEAWITELGDDELAALVELAADADVAELEDDPGRPDPVGVAP